MNKILLSLTFVSAVAGSAVLAEEQRISVNVGDVLYPRFSMAFLTARVLAPFPRSNFIF